MHWAMGGNCLGVARDSNVERIEHRAPRVILFAVCHAARRAPSAVSHALSESDATAR